MRRYRPRYELASFFGIIESRFRLRLISAKGSAHAKAQLIFHRHPRLLRHFATRRNSHHDSRAADESSDARAADRRAHVRVWIVSGISHQRLLPRTFDLSGWVLHRWRVQLYSRAM